MFVSLKRCYGKFIHVVGGAASRWYFRDLSRKKSVTFDGMQLAAETEDEIERSVRALDLLRREQPYCFSVVTRWMERIAQVRETYLRVHFCDGTALIKAKIRIPDNVLAAFLFRLSIERMLFERFHLAEMALNDSRCRIISYRKQLRLMRRFGVRGRVY